MEGPKNERALSGDDKRSAPPGDAAQPIFVCDASAEAERLITTLRSRGYPTVDVPLGMLPTRVRYEVPALVVCDADAHESLRRVRETKDAIGGPLKLLFVGHDDGALRRESEFREMATATLTRPLNLATTLELIESIVGPPPPQGRKARSPRARRSRAPVLVASTRKPYRSDSGAPPPSSSHPPQGEEPLWPTTTTSGLGPALGELSFSIPPGAPDSSRYSSAPYPSLAPGSSSAPPSSQSGRAGGVLSADTRALLLEGQKRVGAHPAQPARPTRLAQSDEAGATIDTELREALGIALSPDHGDEVAADPEEPPPTDGGHASRPAVVSRTSHPASATHTEDDGAAKPHEASQGSRPADVSPLSEEDLASRSLQAPPPPTFPGFPSATASPRGRDPSTPQADTPKAGQRAEAQNLEEQSSAPALTVPPPRRQRSAPAVATPRQSGTAESEPGTAESQPHAAESQSSAAPGEPGTAARASSAPAREQETNPGGKPPTGPPGPNLGSDPPFGTTNVGSKTGAHPSERIWDEGRSAGRASERSDPGTHPSASARFIEVPSHGRRSLESIAARPLMSTPPPLDDLSDLLSPAAPGSSRRPPTSIPLVAPTPHPIAPSTQRGSLRVRAGSEAAQGVPRPSLLPLSAPDGEWAPRRAISGLALAIRLRKSGSFAQEGLGGLRRLVLRDGDILTVISSSESETLGEFLRSRGHLTDEVLANLGPLPRFGRHAGAALIAQGHLRQEDLWPTLRAHAEWVMGRMMQSAELVHLEDKIPARLSDEPSVFGGSAGSEIYLDVLRRVVSSDLAFEALGQGEWKLGHGAYGSLLQEAALGADMEARVNDALTEDLGRLRTRDPDLLVVLLGLTELGVFSVGSPNGVPTRAPVEVRERSAEIDDEAFVERVKSRKQLVDDGDYFSLLGISRMATTYEVERARKVLGDELDMSRLTARTAYLKDELELILDVLEEAHQILKDATRRERYRLALEDVPR